MAIKTIEYTVDITGILPATEQFAGTKGDHRVTKLNIYVCDALYNEIVDNTVDGKAMYRFDVYDGEGGIWSSKASEFTDPNLSIELEERHTRFGGKIIVYLVITALSADNGTEMELYSFPAVLRLNDKPEGIKKDGENYESITGLVEVAKAKADEAADTVNSAVGRLEETAKITFGKSAYQVAVENGFEGDESDWLASLKGEKGDKGDAFTYDDLTDEQKAELKEGIEQCVADQAYDPTSENAQSGIAVAEALKDFDAGDKVDKVTRANVTDPYQYNHADNSVPYLYGVYGDKNNDYEEKQGLIKGSTGIVCETLAEQLEESDPELAEKVRNGVVTDAREYLDEHTVVVRDGNCSIPCGFHSFDRDEDGNIINSVLYYGAAVPKSYMYKYIHDFNGNIRNGTGSSSLQQIQDTKYTGVAIVTKNPNAAALDSTLTDNETIGATGEFATSLGGCSSAQGKRSLAEGTNTIAKGKYSHAEGDNAVALGNESHAEGYNTVAKGSASHAEGYNTVAKGNNSHAEGYQTTAYGNYSHAECTNTIAKGSNSHAEGYETEASGEASHAEGGRSKAKSDYSHAEGFNSVANGKTSHAEGESIANGVISHAEGISTTGEQATYAHAEGRSIANGTDAHSEGNATVADGNASHAEGYNTHAKGDYSHTSGASTIANHAGQFVIGQCNNNKSDTYFEVGCGTHDVQRANCFETGKDKDGNAFICIGETKVTESQLKKLLVLIG